jgi:hypothetical protein
MRSNVKKIFQNEGYSLLELVFTLIVIMVGLSSFYGLTHRGLAQMRINGTKDYAVIAAASELEYIKAISRDKTLENYTGPFKSTNTLSALNDGKGILKIRDYDKANSDLKRVTATVTWSALGRKKSISLSTLVRTP